MQELVWGVGCSVLMASMAACSLSTRAPVQTDGVPVRDPTPGASTIWGSGELVSLSALVGDEEDELDEGAVIHMLAFREQLYLPFRYDPQMALDQRGLAASQDMTWIREGFARLGEAGERVLVRCVEEALVGGATAVHVAGDDRVVLGLACLDMLGDVYGEVALPALVRLATEPNHTTEAILLQRAALDTIRSVGPPGVVARAQSVGEWRAELAGWSSWVKERTAIEARNRTLVGTGRSCDRRCSEELLAAWIHVASNHVAAPGSSFAEPRFVTTLRDYVSARAETWLPWLGEVAKTALERDDVSRLEAGLILDLWAQTAIRRYPSYFRDVVMPTLVLNITSGGSASGDSSRPIRSQLAVRALERATGVVLQTPECGGVLGGPGGTDCLRVQAHFWQGQMVSRRWAI